MGWDKIAPRHGVLQKRRFKENTKKKWKVYFGLEILKNYRYVKRRTAQFVLEVVPFFWAVIFK